MRPAVRATAGGIRSVAGGARAARRWWHAPGRRAAALLLAAGALSGCDASRVAGPGEPAPTILPANYSVEYDSLFGTPRWVRNQDAVGAARPGAPAPFTDAVAFQIVRGFTLRYAAVFRLRPGTDDFVAVWAQGRDGANFVKVQQAYRGLPVDFMGYGTMVLADGAVGSMIGRFMPDIALSTLPAVTRASATDRAVAALAPTVVVPGAPARLTVALIGESLQPRLAWSVMVVHEGAWLSWTVTVDAQSGTVLRVSQNWIEN